MKCAKTAGDWALTTQLEPKPKTAVKRVSSLMIKMSATRDFECRCLGKERKKAETVDAIPLSLMYAFVDVTVDPQAVVGVVGDCTPTSHGLGDFGRVWRPVLQAAE